MVRVQLRVATLKNACMKYCDLTAAVLAGADLEVSQFYCLKQAAGVGISIPVRNKEFNYVIDCSRLVCEKERNLNMCYLGIHYKFITLSTIVFQPT